MNDFSSEIPFYLFLHLCVYVCTCSMCMCMCVLECVEARGDVECLPQYLSILRHNLLMNLELTDLARLMG